MTLTLSVLLFLGGGTALLALAVVLSGGLVWDRIRAITLSSSSVNGRLLYYLDGLRIIWDHPMGVGRGGYLYLQPLYQTGVYTLRFIHNEYLQAALDGGILGGACAIVMVACLLFRKGLPTRERAVIFVIAAHACIDFDFQFTIIPFLLLLCGSGGKAKEVSVPPKGAVTAVGTVLTLGMCYFSLVYALDFGGAPTLACALFPVDLSLQENKLQSHATMEEAKTVAEDILADTDLSMIAWDCEYTVRVQKMDGVGMAEAKYQYLRLNKYRGEVYEDFTQLLENLSAQSYSEEMETYRTLADKVIQQMEEVAEDTSPLAYRIVDKPELGFIPDITERLKAIGEGGEK